MEERDERGEYNLWLNSQGNKFLLNATRKMPVSWFYHELMVFPVVIFAATSGKNKVINKRNVIISFSSVYVHLCVHIVSERCIFKLSKVIINQMILNKFWSREELILTVTGAEIKGALSKAKTKFSGSSMQNTKQNCIPLKYDSKKTYILLHRRDR